MSHTCATQERVAEDWTLPSISGRGFQGMEMKAIKMTFLSPFFFAIFVQHRFKHGLPNVLIKPVGK